jgi:hypothetical protein
MVCHLPKTHQDAIQLTQELGIRYLWIDSICIIQDDDEDWERESANMLSVYSKSYLTIAASNGENSHKGLFTEISPRKYVQVGCAFGNTHGQALAFNCSLQGEALCMHVEREEKHPLFPMFMNYITLPEEPLSKRGWAFQERVLSRRILHYGTQQLFFECNEGYRGEDGMFLPARFDTIQEEIDERHHGTDDVNFIARTNESQHSLDRDKLLKIWYRLILSYRNR